MSRSAIYQFFMWKYGKRDREQRREKKKVRQEEKLAYDNLVKANRIIAEQDEEIEKLRAEVVLLKKALQLGRRRCDRKVFGNPDLVRLIDETMEECQVTDCVRRMCEDVGMTKSDYYYRKRKFYL